MTVPCLGVAVASHVSWKLSECVCVWCIVSVSGDQTSCVGRVTVVIGACLPCMEWQRD